MTPSRTDTPTQANSYAAIALVSCAILLFQVLVTRIRSVTLAAVALPVRRVA